LTFEFFQGGNAITKVKHQIWWDKSNIPAEGEIFKNFNLKPNDPEEGRIQKLRTKILEFRDGEISSARAKLVTESYRRTEGEPPVIRKAKAFLHIMRHIPIEILPGELIIGNPNSGFGKVEIDPEYMTDWLDTEVIVDGKKQTELEALKIRKYNRLNISDSDLKILTEEIFPYWRGKTLMALVRKELKKYHKDVLDHIDFAQVATPVWGKGFSHTIQDYNSVLKLGFDRIKKDIDLKIKEIETKKKNSRKDIERKYFYEAMKLCADAVVVYARRCSQLAKKMGEKEKNKKRRAELESIAKICGRVPRKPAGSFWEALQALHFLHMATPLAEGGVSHSVGRLDQYLFPYLLNDQEKSLLDNKKAQELLECFFLKFYEFQTIRDLRSSKPLAGDRTNDKITIGGVDENGHDCTNRLSYMILEGYSHVHLKEPNISVRIHRNTPNEFMRHMLEVVRLGSGIPIPLNGDVIIPSLTGVCGVSLKDARNYADLGCQENIIDPNTAVGSDCNGHNNAGWFNLTKIIELALNNGKNPLNGKQVGPKTGNPRKFKSMDDFVAAFQKQLEYAVEKNVMANQVVEDIFLKHYPVAYHNLMHPNTRETGLDYNGGGCKYNWVGAIGVGIANTGDSLCAIDNVIFKEKKFTWAQLLSALDSNWKNFDVLRRTCINYPKYGSDSEEADFWVRKVTEMFFDAYESHEIKRGGKFVCGLFTMGMHLLLGENIGATPDGRNAGEILADSTCGSRYAPKLGFTATHKSSSKIDTYRTPNGFTFNQILTRSLVSTERDLAKWADLLRVYFDLGGQTVQYSVIDKNDLLKAQLEPEKYQDLIVRIGGYSAIFIDLSKEIQDDIIARSY